MQLLGHVTVGSPLVCKSENELNAHSLCAGGENDTNACGKTKGGKQEINEKNP